MRFLTADYLYPLYIKPIREGVLQISDKGEVVAVLESRADISKEKLEIFNGVLCPGFINAHCHLELSHLKGIAEKGRGFLDFIKTIKKRGEFNHKEIQNGIEKAEQEMIKNGIVAVGDICNTKDTIWQKQKSNMKYYNYIEIFGVETSETEIIISNALHIRDQFRAAGLQATITPHAPYSVPPIMMQKILSFFDTKDHVFSIHMHETEAENKLFEHKKGKFYTWLNNINASSEIWEKRNKSIDIVKELKDQRILLVHNTFVKKEDLIDSYYCTCPNANLYIEDALPDYSIFDVEKLCVGTDSLASNNSLSILKELLTIQKNTDFDLNKLLKIASKNGAEALRFLDLGTFEKGKKPGVNLLQRLNGPKLTKKSLVRKLY